MGQIRVLNEGTINQIAAGEVVESPASVVKELVENSLDAGATSIWIEIRGGGFQLIEVADNGCGMNQDDAILCFERHATSKISSINDLNALNSMGFRGEALASIASISHVELTTALEGRSGTSVEISHGQIKSVKPAARAKGTTFSIRSLFYNVPARKKFQKSSTATGAEIYKCVLSLALANPHVGFELTVGDGISLTVPASHESTFIHQLEQRIDHLFEDAFLQNKRAISAEKEGYHLQGFLGSPTDDRANKTGQYLYVNGRSVFSPLVSDAVKSGYGQRIDTRRHPIFVLHLTVPQDKVDVNVHPQKQQVRFEEEGFIYQFLQTATHAALQDTPIQREDSSLGQLPRFQENVNAPSFLTAPLLIRESLDDKSLPLVKEPEVIALFKVYLILNGSSLSPPQEGLVWVHLQRAHEWLLQREFFARPIVERSQGLLIPLPLILTPHELKMLQEKKPFLEEVGFTLERSGEDSYFVQGLPSFIQERDALDVIRQLLDQPAGYQMLTQFVSKKKTEFMLQEALALWHKVKALNNKEIVTLVGLDAIEKLFK
ncbi:MAG: DNA mismatch repair endonuclease MutL [Candidatus Rhabdochlamydia sp.]